MTSQAGADLVQLEAARVGRHDGASPRGRILIVEDNPTNQKVARRMLERLGYEADLATNGREALETLRTTSYDAVLMDGQMPEMDGYEATRQIRAQIAGGGPTIIAMTANAMADDRERCFEVGMNDYLTKPAELHELDAMLERWIVRDEPALKIEPSPSSQPPAATAASVASAPEPASERGASDEADTPAVDRERLELLGLLGGHGGPTLADEFGVDARKLLAEMKAALDDGDAEELRRSAHALKGSSGNLGAARLSALAAGLEQLARDDVLGAAAALMQQAEAECDRVIEALRDLEAAA